MAKKQTPSVEETKVEKPIVEETNTNVETNSEEVKKEETPVITEESNEGEEQPVFTEEKSPEEKLIDETFEKAASEVDTKIDSIQKEEVKIETPVVTEEKINELEDQQKSDENEEIEDEYKELLLEGEDAQLVLNSIVEEEKLDLSKDKVQLAIKQDEKDSIYYRINSNDGEWSEWKLYAVIEVETEKIPLEGLDAEIERILEEEHYFSFSSCGRHIVNGNYSEDTLKVFYEEFKLAGILINKNHYDLMDLFKQKFG